LSGGWTSGRQWNLDPFQTHQGQQRPSTWLALGRIPGATQPSQQAHAGQPQQAKPSPTNQDGYSVPSFTPSQAGATAVRTKTPPGADDALEARPCSRMVQPSHDDQHGVPTLPSSPPYPRPAGPVRPAPNGPGETHTRRTRRTGRSAASFKILTIRPRAHVPLPL